VKHLEDLGAELDRLSELIREIDRAQRNIFVSTSSNRLLIVESNALDEEFGA
jgi:hypothetical protein